MSRITAIAPLLTGLVCLTVNIAFTQPGRAASTDETAQAGATAEEVLPQPLDDTPFPKSFANSIDDATSTRTYTFNVASQCAFVASLSGLTGNALLQLEDSSNNVLAISNQPGQQKENLTKNLQPGTYILSVSQAAAGSISYDLAMSAAYLANDTVVSGLFDIQDPEFDIHDHQVAWRDNYGQLFVAPVDPASGSFDLLKATLVDRNLAVYPDVVNGPEWAYAKSGNRIVYTRDNNGIFYIAQAKAVEGIWETSQLPNTRNGYKPIGSMDPDYDEPLVKYLPGTADPRREGAAWRNLDHPEIGSVYSGDAQFKGGRWMPGRLSFVCSILSQGTYQLFEVDVTTGAVTQLTTGPDQKLLPFAARAPEFNNEVIITTSESKSVNAKYYKWTGIYRQINGIWTRIKQIPSPIKDLPAVQSAEPFSAGGRTYVSFIIGRAVERGDDGRKDGAQVWIASIDPAYEFYRKVSSKDARIRRSDPEPFSTEFGSFIYYTEIVGAKRRTHRTTTGLPATVSE